VGLPRGEYVADVDENGTVIDGYTADRLIYRRRNVRVNTVYGYSATEQALEDIDVWLQRRGWLRAEYTDGSVPRGMIRNTGQAQWTPQQIREYERDVNDTYSGQTPERLRLRVLPPGFELETYPDNAEKYKPEYDLFLIKLVVSHFGVTLAELGFSEAKGLGSTGWHEGQADVQERQSTLPTVRWLEGLLTDISRKHLGMPPELEFRFLGLEDEDEAAADQVAQQRIQYGRMTLNEDRDRLGLPRYEFDEADKPMVMTSRGVILLAGAAERGEPGSNIGAEKDNRAAATEPADNGDGEEPDTEADSGAADGKDKDEEERADAVKAELAAFRRWSRRNPEPVRPFEFQTVTKADAPDLAYEPVVFATQGGDAAPKGEPVAWPGWDRDQDTATVWAGRLKRGLRQAVNSEQLAERWLAQELVKADEPDPTTAATYQQPPQEDGTAGWAVALAAAFLAAQGIALTAPLAAATTAIWAEGWAIGDAAARAVLAGQNKARFAWPVGDDGAARRTLTTSTASALQAFVDGNRSSIPRLADRRLYVLARILADAKGRGLTAKQLAQALQDALQDDAWLRMVALTELTRASAAAARTAYTAAGLTRWQWNTEPDACPICVANQEAGPRTIGEAWPDGSQMPPAHPHCRCSVLPEYDQW
jgi:hypothetical protein